VPAGAPVVTIMDLSAGGSGSTSPKDQVGAVRLGQALYLRRHYPGKRYAGQVSFVASQAEFTPRTSNAGRAA